MEKDVRATHKDNTEIHDCVYPRSRRKNVEKHSRWILQVAETLMAIVIILKNKKYTLKHISIEINVFVKVTTAIRMYIIIYI